MPDLGDGGADSGEAPAGDGEGSGADQPVASDANAALGGAEVAAFDDAPAAEAAFGAAAPAARETAVEGAAPEAAVEGAAPETTGPTVTASTSSRARKPKPNGRFEDYVGEAPKRKVAGPAAPREPRVRQRVTAVSAFAVGEVIEYKWPGTQDWWLAHVRKFKAPNTYTLLFPEDGSRFECTLDEKNWRRVVAE